MRAVVQRVDQASVETEGGVCGAIERGLLVYLGVHREDAEADANYLAEKVAHLRVFPDEAGLMNRSVKQTGGRVLVVSAFTVEADARRGRRPSFEQAAHPDRAAILYEMFCDALRRWGLVVATGRFGGDMNVSSTNAGPVCILLDSRRLF